MPDKMPWEEDWGGKPDAPAPWEEDWSGATVDATPPIASKTTVINKPTVLADPGAAWLGGSKSKPFAYDDDTKLMTRNGRRLAPTYLAQTEVIAKAPTLSETPTNKDDVPPGYKMSMPEPNRVRGVMLDKRAASGLPLHEGTTAEAIQEAVPNPENRRPSIASRLGNQLLHSATLGAFGEPATDLASLSPEAEGAIEAIGMAGEPFEEARRLLSAFNLISEPEAPRYVGKSAHELVSMVGEPIREAMRPQPGESVGDKAAMFLPRLAAKAYEATALDPVNAAQMAMGLGVRAGKLPTLKGVKQLLAGADAAGEMRDVSKMTSGLEAALGYAFTPTMAVSTGHNIANMGEAISEDGLAGALDTLPDVAMTGAFTALGARPLAKAASGAVDTARTAHNLKKTQRIVEENYQRALVKASLNEKAGKPRLEGMDEGELTAYFSDERNAEPLRRTQSVDELETIAKQMFTGRPDTKVVIHESWDSVPENLRPADSAAQATIPSLIDNRSDTIHVIRNAPNATGGGLIRNVKHEIGHKLDDFKPEEVTDALSGMMRERLPQMMAEHGVPAGEVTRLLSMDQPAFAAEMKRMAADPRPEIAALPTRLAREAVATMMQQYRADPSKVSLFMAKAARKIPGVQMTANDIRAIMSERINAREGGAAQMEMAGEKPAEIAPKTDAPTGQPPVAAKKGDRVYLPSSDPSIRLFDTGTVTSIGRDGKVRVVVGGRKGKDGDRFVELPPDQVMLEPPISARKTVPTPDQIAEQQRASDIARQQRQNIADVEADRAFVAEAIESQRPLLNKVLEQPIGPETKQLEPGADARPGLLEEIINQAEGTRNDPFMLRAPDGGRLRAKTGGKPPRETIDPLIPTVPYDTRNLSYQNVGEYDFKPAKINPEMKPDEWRAYAEQQMEYFGVPHTRPPEADPRGFHLKDMGDDGRVVTLYDGDNIATSARIGRDGSVLWLWAAKGSFRPQESPYWRGGNDSVSKLGRWLALRDDARPYVRIQRELARQGTRRTGDELYTEKGARAIDETLIPPRQAVAVIDGLRDRPRLIAQATGMHYAYVEKGIADLVGGRYDSPEAMDVVQWAHGELRSAYENEILGARDLYAGRGGGVQEGVQGGNPEVVPGRPAGTGAADAVGGERTVGDVAPPTEATAPQERPDINYQNTERESFSRANKNLIDPIRGDLIRFGSTLVDKHNTLESFVNKMSEGLEGSAKLETQKMAADIFEDAKAYRQGQIEVESVLDKLEQGVKAKGNLGKPESGPTRDLLEAVDAAREAVDIPHRRKDTDVEREAIKLRAKLGRQGVINLAVDVAKGMTLPKGIKNAITGNLRMLSDVETLAIRMEMNDLKSLEDGMNDPKKFMENVLLANAYRTTGSDPARAMRMRRWDIGMSDVDRVRSVIYDMIYDPSSRNAAALANKDSAFHKEAVRNMNKQLERTKKFLKDELKIEKVEDIPDALLLDKRFMKNFVDRMSAAVAPFSAKARTWYLNSILSRPKTHVANMTGNTLNFVTEYYGHRRLEALINDLAKNKEGVRSSDLSGLMSQLISIQNSAFKQAMALEGSSLKIDGGLVGQAGKDAKEFFKTRESQLRRRIEGDDWIGELREKKQSFAGKPGKAITLPSRALGAADEFSKSLIGHMEALVNARMIARQSGHAVGSESYNAEVYKQLADYDSQAWHRALDRAEYMAFQQENRKIVKSLLALRHAHPNLSFVVPFITTPVNLFARAAEFVPGVGIRFRGDIGLTKGALAAKGDESANYKSRMIAAQTMGSAATVMIAALGLDAFKEDNDEPWITGSEPPPKFSKGEREARQRSLQPYTIKNPFGDGRVSFKRLDPLSTTTAVIVDGVHAIRDLARHGDPTRAAAILKQSLLGQAIGKTFLQTPGEIIQWLQDRPGADPLGPVKTIAAGFYPGILQAATQFFFEDFVRERRQYGAKEGDLGQGPAGRFAKTFLNRVTGLPSIPGLGTLAEPGVTVYGDEKRLGGSPLYRFTMPFDYYPGGSPDARTFDLRFLRGLETLPDAEDSLPTEMPPTVRLGGQTVALSPEDWAAAEKERGKLYLNTLRAAGLTRDRRKPMEAWELEAAKEINRTAGQVAQPYAAKYFGGK